MAITVTHAKERPCYPRPQTPPHDPAAHTRALSTPHTPSRPLHLRPAQERQRAQELVAVLLIIALAAICVTALLTVPIITG